MIGDISRGSVWTATMPEPSGLRPVVVLTRNVAIPVLANVTIVEVTRSVHGLRTEVELGPEEGLRYDCVANCDNLATVPKDWLRSWVGELGPKKLDELARAVRVALDV
jgi:mRNA interferase MazF